VNTVPIVAAISLNDVGHPVYAKITPFTGFTLSRLGCSLARIAQLPISHVAAQPLASGAAAVVDGK
jgi:hypothetical protein